MVLNKNSLLGKIPGAKDPNANVIGTKGTFNDTKKLTPKDLLGKIPGAKDPNAEVIGKSGTFNPITGTYSGGSRSGGSSNGSSSNNSKSNQTTIQEPEVKIDPRALSGGIANDRRKYQIGLAEQQKRLLDQQRNLNKQSIQSTQQGGYYIDPYGNKISSMKSELELNKGVPNQEVKKDYFEQFGRIPFAEQLSSGKKFVGSFVKIGEPGADIQKVEEQGNIFVSKAKDQYAKNIFSNITANQLEKERFEKEQKELMIKQEEQNKIFAKNKREANALNSAKNLEISGGFQLAGQQIQRWGDDILKSNAKINLLPTDPLFLMSNVLGDAPKKFTGGIVKGIGETTEGAGDLIKLASKRQTYYDLANAGKGTAEYFINVGKTAEIKGIKVKPGDLFPVQLDIQPGKQTKKDIETAKLLGLTAGTKAVSNFVKDPFTESGKMVGSAVLISGATSGANKLLGLGKAGVKIAKGGKYVKYEGLYETKPSNLIKGRYKKGTPRTTQTEFIKGANPKTGFSSTGNLTDTLLNPRTGKGKVLNQQPQGSDIAGLYASTGKANKTYLRISEEAYNLKPRIPFVNMPTKTKPATLRLVGITKPKRLTSISKFSNIKQGKKVFDTANVSKNVPLTTPATELKIKIENEFGLRPGTILTTKRVKGTQDFTFIKGVFVETPRVRVMPSKPRMNIINPSNQRIKANKVLINQPKTTRSISFSSSISQARNPGTFYNPSSLFKDSSSSSYSRKRFSSSPSRSNSSSVISLSPSNIISPSRVSSSNPRPSPSKNPFMSSGSSSKGSSSSFISSSNVFSPSSSTSRGSNSSIISQPKNPIYRQKNPFTPTKYNNKAKRNVYLLKNKVSFGFFGGKTKTQKVRLI